MMEPDDGPPEGMEGLEKELLEERIRSKELLNRLKYAQADLENFRKRAEKEMAEARESSVRDLVGRLLVVLDELALAVRHAKAEAKDGDLSEGFTMVQRNLEAALESAGVRRIDSLGKPFDPSFQEAAEKVEGANSEGLTVVEELRPGYTFRGQVLRPSLVKVGPKAGAEEDRE